MQPTAILFIVFALSGFAGIIYESIWSHYLKLFLGHAAYAQTIVLVLFMGGLALGSWIGARLERRIDDSLMAYVAVEIGIGVLALVFHPVYLGTTTTALGTIFPRLADPFAIQSAKVVLSAALLLPQAVLIGMTFPFMAVGVLQRALLPTGFTVSSLYFVNSLGAAVGVLASGFVFIAWFGLPGTIRVAGSLNLLVALIVFLMVRRLPLAASATPSAATRAPPGRDAGGLRRLVVIAALLTGCASFMYEIAWIRMLNMVLGTSTHSFELMLSAFIFGLALGGWWIRRHLDRVRHLLSLLGFIQIAMAVLALSTLAFYDFSFFLMSAVFYAVAKTPLGYGLFMIFSNGIAFLIMLPATICAGMTLPLMTHFLLARGHGNRSVGEVYAANTTGAILGVVLTVHVLVPLFSLKAALLAGGALDIALGLYLLRHYIAPLDAPAARAAAFGACAFALVTAAFVDLDPLKMAAGVFRHGGPMLDDGAAVEMHRDGKTASVTVFSMDGTRRVIATNGKVDASLEFDPERPASQDESTQILTGAIPLMIKPEARRAAVIGIGSGMTTHVLLQSPAIERVDTIEIEAQMVAGARAFLPHVAATFGDPRSRIRIDDARTYFAANQSRYDLIVSEPSNPWVSGVSALFSVEFYRLIKGHLAAGGLFAQWLQLYEIDLSLLASVFKAFGGEFPDYRVFEMGDGNLLLLASPAGEFSFAPDKIFAMGAMPGLLGRVGIDTPADLASRYVASDRILQPFFAAYPTPANSDFHPVLDLNAAYKRFLDADSMRFSEFTRASVPVREMLGDLALTASGIGARRDSPYATLAALSNARVMTDWLVHGQRADAAVLPEWFALHASLLDRTDPPCADAAARHVWLDALVTIGRATLPFLENAEAVALLDRILAPACMGDDPIARDWVGLLDAVASRQAEPMHAAASALLARAEDAMQRGHRQFLIEAYLLGNIARGRSAENLSFWRDLEPKERADLGLSTTVRLLRAHSGERRWRAP
jgi:spermidine synthase